MYKSCKTAYSAERQQRFQEALFSLLQKQAYQTVTITTLCQTAGIPRNAFYRYFDTIDDVLHAQIDALVRDASLFLWNRADVSSYLRFWKERKAILDILERNGLSAVLVMRAMALLADQYKGTDLSFQNIQGICYVNSLTTILIHWHHEGMERPVEEIEDAFWKIFQRI